MLAQHVVVAVATIGVAALVARHLGAADYGLYEYAFTLAGIFGVVSTFGLRAVTVRSVAGMSGAIAEDEVARYARMMLTLRVGLALVVVPLAVLATSLIQDSRRVVLVVFLAALTLPFEAMSTLLRDIFQGKERMDVEAIALVTIRVATLIGTVAAVLLGGDLIVIVAVYASGAVVGTITPWVAARREGIPMRPRFAISEALEQLRQGLPFFGTAAVALAVWEVNPVLLAELSGLAAVGIYAAGTRMIGPLEMLPDSVATALMPTVARMDADPDLDANPLLRRVFFALAVMGLPIGIGGALSAESLVLLIFGEGFDGAAPVLQLAVAAVPFEFITIPAMYVLGAIHQQPSVFGLTLVAGVSNVALNLALIPRYGATGCGIAILVVAVASFIGAVVLLRRHLSVWGGPYLRLGAANLLMFGAVYGVRDYGALLMVPVGAAVYAAAIIGLRVVKLDELRAVLTGRLPSSEES